MKMYGRTKHYQMTKLCGGIRLSTFSVAVGITACGPQGGDFYDTDAERSTEALYRTGSRWPEKGDGSKGTTIDVCYKWTGAATVTYATLAAYATNALDIARSTWGRVANIDFIDKGICPDPAPSSGIQLQLRDSNGSSSGVGYHTSDHTHVKLDVTDNRQPVVTVHEFGHALGFSHEFNRVDWAGTNRINKPCTTNADCALVDNDFGDSCVRVPSGVACASGNTDCVCRRLGGEELGVTSEADDDSVMASTYTGNRPDGNGNGVAHPEVSLSAYDAIGAQQVYGPKLPGMLVGKMGLCAQRWPNAGVGSYTFTSSCDNEPTDLWNWKYNGLLESTKGSTKLCLGTSAAAVPNDQTKLVTLDCTADTQRKISFDGVKLKVMGNMCVVAKASTVGSGIETKYCDNAADNLSRWDIRNKTSIVLHGSSLCLANVGDATAPGSLITLRQCASGTEQTFRYDAGVITTYSDRCLSVLGGADTEGSNIGLASVCSSSNGNQFFYLTGPVSNQSMCIDTMDIKGNEALAVSACDGSADQEWDYYFPNRFFVNTAFSSCGDRTDPGATAWKQYDSDSIYVDVDTTACAFGTTPLYFTSLSGDTHHWTASGATAIYSPTQHGFRVYVSASDITPEKANTDDWHINWEGHPDGVRAKYSCTGETSPTNTNWQQYNSDGIYVDIDTSACGFSEAPLYFTSLGGEKNHRKSLGVSSIYNPKTSGFRVYLNYSGITVAQAKSWQWHVQWQARPDPGNGSCVGSTDPSAWQQYNSDGIYVDVGAKCTSEKIPLVFTSLAGNSNHWTAEGVTSLYDQTEYGLRVYLYKSGITAADALSKGWHVNWRATGNDWTP